MKTGPEWCARAVLKDNCIVFRKVRVYLFCWLALPGVSLGSIAVYLGIIKIDAIIRHKCVRHSGKSRAQAPDKQGGTQEKPVVVTKHAWK